MGERLFDALIVIDVQQALVDGHPSKEDSFLVAVGAMIDACRRAGVPVLYVCHDGGAGDELERGTDGWRVHCAVAPQAGEIVVDKRFNSAFRQTGLHETLQSLGAKRIVMCGMQTEFCFDVSVKVAFELGYDVTVPREAVTTFDSGRSSYRLLRRSHLGRPLCARAGYGRRRRRACRSLTFSSCAFAGYARASSLTSRFGWYHASQEIGRKGPFSRRQEERM